MTFNIGDKVRLKTPEELYPDNSRLRASYSAQQFYINHKNDVFTVTSDNYGLTFIEVPGRFNEKCFVLVSAHEEVKEDEVLSLFF